MSVKAKLPPEDPETVARRKAAELAAETGRIEATQETLSQDTRAIIRNFGRLASGSGSSLVSNRPARNGGPPGFKLGSLDLRSLALR